MFPKPSDGGKTSPFSTADHVLQTSFPKPSNGGTSHPQCLCFLFVIFRARILPAAQHIILLRDLEVAQELSGRNRH